MKDKDVMNEKMLSDSINKRREWSKKYNVSERILFDLFSEFSSIMMLQKAEEKSNKSLKTNSSKQFAKGGKPLSKYEQNIGEVLKTKESEKMSKKLKLATTNSDLY